MDIKLSRTTTFYLASFLAGASVTLACGGGDGEDTDADSGLSAATLSSGGNSTMTGVGETGSDTAASDSSTTDSTTDPSTTDPSTTDPSTTDTTGDTGGSPYTGGWDIGDCQDDVVAGAWDPYAMGPGVVLPDWYLTDRYGEMVRVRDFCHNAIYFDYSALW